MSDESDNDAKDNKTSKDGNWFQPGKITIVEQRKMMELIEFNSNRDADEDVPKGSQRNSLNKKESMRSSIKTEIDSLG